MHDIEPHYSWRDEYIASEDESSPFYGREYDEFTFRQKVYNYFVHPQWDSFGSQTLYTKILFADYEKGYAILEFIGEWNDCLYNDIMFLKREVIEPLMQNGIFKFVLICENVLNFHGSDDCYYEEWQEEVMEEDGWIVFANVLQHVEEEMKATALQQYVFFGGIFNDVNWRPLKPKFVVERIDELFNTVLNLK